MKTNISHSPALLLAMALGLGVVLLLAAPAGAQDANTPTTPGAGATPGANATTPLGEQTVLVHNRTADPNATANPPGPAFLSVSLEDLTLHTLRVSSVEVTVTLAEDGATVARGHRNVSVYDGNASLKGITASAVTKGGNLSGRHLNVQVKVGDQLALAVGGVLGAPSAPGRFRVNEVVWPPDSPVSPSGPALATFQNGWSRDRLTVAFAPTPSAALVNATMFLVATSVQDSGPNSEVYHREEPTIRSPGGNVFATFELDHMPPVLSWRATLRVAGQDRAAAWAEVNFPLASGQGFGYDPGTPAVAEAVGAFHDVEERKDTVTLPNSVLLSGDQDLTRCLRPAPTFTSTQGQASGRLDEFRSERGPQALAGCGDPRAAEPTGNATVPAAGGCKEGNAASVPGNTTNSCKLDSTSFNHRPPPQLPGIRDVLPFAFVAVVALLVAVVAVSRRGVR